MKFIFLSHLTNTFLCCKDTGSSVLLTLNISSGKNISSSRVPYEKNISYLEGASLLQFIHASCEDDFENEEIYLSGMQISAQRWDDTHTQITFLLEHGLLQFTSYYPHYLKNSVAGEGANYFLSSLAKITQQQINFEEYGNVTAILQ